MSSAIAAVDAYLERTADERLAELVEFLRIPTVGVLSQHQADMRAGADWIVTHMRSIGLENVVASPCAVFSTLNKA